MQDLTKASPRTTATKQRVRTGKNVSTSEYISTSPGQEGFIPTIISAAITAGIAESGLPGRMSKSPVFELLRTKALHVRTQGIAWEFVPGSELGGFIQVHMFGRHCQYYARTADLGRNTEHIRLYQRVDA